MTLYELNVTHIYMLVKNNVLVLHVWTNGELIKAFSPYLVISGSPFEWFWKVFPMHSHIYCPHLRYCSSLFALSIKRRKNVDVFKRLTYFCRENGHGLRSSLTCISFDSVICGNWNSLTVYVWEFYAIIALFCGSGVKANHWIIIRMDICGYRIYEKYIVIMLHPI